MAGSLHFGSESSTDHILFFLSGVNFMLWAHSIADAACRSQLDNAHIIGREMWEFFEPFLASAFVFFRILSGCLYFYLATSLPETVEGESNDKPFAHFERTSLHSSMSEDEKNVLGLTRFMLRNQAVSKQSLTVCQGKNATTVYYSTKNYRNQEIYFASVIVIPFAVIPFVAYDSVSRHSKNMKNTQLKFIVEVVINITVTLVCLWLICCHFVLSWKKSKKCLKCTKRLNGTNCKECAASDCNNCQCSFVCKYCQDHCRCNLFEHKLKQFDVEITVFFVFTLMAAIFYIMAVSVESGGDRAADILGLFAVILQSLILFSTILVHKPLKLVQFNCRISFFLSIFFLWPYCLLLLWRLYLLTLRESILIVSFTRNHSLEHLHHCLLTFKFMLLFSHIV